MPAHFTHLDGDKRKSSPDRLTLQDNSLLIGFCGFANSHEGPQIRWKSAKRRPQATGRVETVPGGSRFHRLPLLPFETHRVVIERAPQRVRIKGEKRLDNPFSGSSGPIQRIPASG